MCRKADAYSQPLQLHQPPRSAKRPLPPKKSSKTRRKKLRAKKRKRNRNLHQSKKMRKTKMAMLTLKSPRRRQAKVAGQLLLPRPQKVEQSQRKMIWRR